MERRSRRERALALVGSVAFVIGTLDPLEGSVLILAGAVLLAIAEGAGRRQESSIVFWSWTVGLLIVGVGALWGLSALGGVGGHTGRSYWWLLVCLPYPLGSLMSLGGVVVRVRRAFADRATARLSAA